MHPSKYKGKTSRTWLILSDPKVMLFNNPSLHNSIIQPYLHPAVMICHDGYEGRFHHWHRCPGYVLKRFWKETFSKIARSPKPWLKFFTSKILINSSQKRLEMLPVLFTSFNLNRFQHEPHLRLYLHNSEPQHLLGASAITRNSGSVPLGRTKIRLFPCHLCLHLFNDSCDSRNLHRFILHAVFK